MSATGGGFQEGRLSPLNSIDEGRAEMSLGRARGAGLGFELQAVGEKRDRMVKADQGDELEDLLDTESGGEGGP